MGWLNILNPFTSPGDVIGEVTGTTKQNELNSAMAAQQQQWTRENMGYAAQLQERAYDKSFANARDLANTAHQREVADLKAAGLNPILSGLGGQGASTPNQSMDAPSALPGPSANQGMRGTDILGAATDLMGVVSSAKDLKLTAEEIQKTANESKVLSWENQKVGSEAFVKSMTANSQINAINAQNKAAQSAAQREKYYNEQDMKNPNMNYWLDKAGAGGAANSGKKVLEGAQLLLKIMGYF